MFLRLYRVSIRSISVVDAGIKFCFYNVNSFLEKTAFERVASWGIIKNCDAVIKDNAKLRSTGMGVAELIILY